MSEIGIHRLEDSVFHRSSLGAKLAGIACGASIGGENHDLVMVLLDAAKRAEEEYEVMLGLQAELTSLNLASHQEMPVTRRWQRFSDREVQDLFAAVNQIAFASSGLFREELQEELKRRNLPHIFEGKDNEQKS